MSVKASHPGHCPACDEPIEVGEVICCVDYLLPLEQRRHPTVWRHVSCPDPLATEHPVCTTCWLTHPEGACDR